MRRPLKLGLLVGILTAVLATPAYADVSCYGDELAGNRTASGEVFSPGEFTAASPYLPFGSLVLVSDLLSGHFVVVRINDRGPFAAGRDLDMSCGSMVALLGKAGVFPLHWHVL